MNVKAFNFTLAKFSPRSIEIKEKNMDLIWTVVVVLFIMWLLGFSIHIGGRLIHLLLVLAVIGIVYNLFVGRRII